MEIKNKINGTNLFLIVLVIGLIMYINFCQEKDYRTKSEGKALAEKSEESIEMLYNLFEALNKIDSSKIIINNFITNNEIAKSKKDSIVASNPLLADSLFLYWINVLRTDTIFEYLIDDKVYRYSW